MIPNDLSVLYLHPEAESVSKTDANGGRAVNSQLHQEARTAVADRKLAESGLGLYNDKPANLDCIAERPEHRAMIYLRAQGKTLKEICTATGYSYHWVAQIVRQSWFKKRVLELMDEEGRDQLQTILKAEVIPSVEALIEIRDNDKAKHSDKISAVKELLDRYLGKSVAKVETTTKLTVSEAATEAERNAEELDRINQELSARGVRNVISQSN